MTSPCEGSPWIARWNAEPRLRDPYLCDPPRPAPREGESLVAFMERRYRSLRDVGLPPALIAECLLAEAEEQGCVREARMALARHEIV